MTSPHQNSSRLLYLAVLGLWCASSLDGAGVQAVNSLIPRPSLVYLSSSGSTTATITLVANVAYNPTAIVSAVTLTQVTSSGQLIQTIGRMYDDGTHGDAMANDNNFSVQVSLTAAAPTQFCYRATAAYTGVLLRSQSAVSCVSFANPSYSKPPDPSKLVSDPQTNGVVAVNQLVFTIVPAAPNPDSIAAGIATSVGGTIVGYSSTARMYELEVSTASLDQLTAIENTIAANPNVGVVAKNYVGTLQGTPVDNDLAHLDSTSAAAYTIVNANPAYQLLADTATPLHSVVVGVADSGVQASIAEFAGINVIGTNNNVILRPLDRTDTDPNSHGTSVAGIMGAECDLCNTQTAVGMNGILAGVHVPGDPPSPTGRVPYSIASRSFSLSAFAQVAPAIDDLVANGHTDVVLLALSWQSIASCPVGSTSCIPATAFSAYTQILQTALAAPPNASVTVVVAAGNDTMNANGTLPAAVATQTPIPANLIVVGATCVDSSSLGCAAPDNRLPTSNWGTAITLAAPGIVYAPTKTSGAYQFIAGTSGAAALVAGAAGLLRSINPGLAPADISNLLMNGAKPITTDQRIGPRLNLYGSVSLAARPVDVFFLIDTTSSMGPALNGIKNSAVAIVNSLQSQHLNVNFGLGQFRDYPIAPFGGSIDFPYALVQDISPPVKDSTNANVALRGNLNIANAVNTLQLGWGNDPPEAQLPALYQVATGEGQDLANPTASDYIAAGKGASWRPCAGSPAPARCGNLRVVVLVTDAPFHPFSGDSVFQPDPQFLEWVGSTPFYPGPGMDTTIGKLTAKGIQVIGVQPSTEPTAVANLNSVASGTSTLALQPVDCLGDGSFVIPLNGPIVCPAHADGTGVNTAIVNAILGLLQAPPI